MLLDSHCPLKSSPFPPPPSPLLSLLSLLFSLDVSTAASYSFILVLVSLVSVIDSAVLVLCAASKLDVFNIKPLHPLDYQTHYTNSQVIGSPVF